jgi:branched-chain amino acid transport system substrate-binding protein
MKRIIYLSILMAGFLGLCFSPASYAAGTIKVGIVDTYSGPPANLSKDVLDGFKLAVEEINAKGGVLGKKIEFFTRDSKFNPAIGLARPRNWS